MQNENRFFIYFAPGPYPQLTAALNLNKLKFVWLPEPLIGNIVVVNNSTTTHLLKKLKLLRQWI